jgi:Flp pilus assembly protein TadG
VFVRLSAFQQRRSVRTARRGAFTVEFALTVPIVFIITLGFIELTRVVMLDNSSENAAYEGARAAIIPGGTASRAQAQANEILTAVGAQGSSVSVSPTVIDDSVKEVTVTVEVPLSSNIWVPTVFTNGLVVRHSCKLKREKLVVQDD